jgi:ribosomal protein L29
LIANLFSLAVHSLLQLPHRVHEFRHQVAEVFTRIPEG